MLTTEVFLNLNVLLNLKKNKIPPINEIYKPNGSVYKYVQDSTVSILNKETQKQQTKGFIQFVKCCS